MGNVADTRNKLDQVERDYNHLWTAIREKQGAGQVVPEDDYKKLYEFDTERKKLSLKVDSAGTPPAPTGGRRLLRQEVGPEEIAEGGRARGPGFPSQEYWRPSGTSCWSWRNGCTSASSDKTRR